MVKVAKFSGCESSVLNCRSPVQLHLLSPLVPVGLLLPPLSDALDSLDDIN